MALGIGGSGCPSPLPPTDGSSGTEPTGTSGGTTSGEASSSGTTSGSTGLDSSGSGEPGSCGDGVLDPEEACDGEALPDGETCEAHGYGRGLPACALDCSAIIYAVCPDYPECGNGEIGPGEECDGTELGGMSCDDLPNFTGNGLTCTRVCTLDASGCLFCQENEQSCDGGEACCDPRAECKSTVSVGKRCCIPGALGACS
ncbi:hypothetical protein [Paraliomyxa miuraensis]|uniref:hypothetical protein n=1 Tax=Paraliomyxa miuraensis TaxID=376150 RepID=UPI00224F1CB8|nr:hypothetical protein [Paraliomyxa miuraensis]MCX4242671.1 hypothetical protein [Paraliomyxa miuraensis]